MAIQLSTDYLAGMSDKSFIDVAIKTGHFTPEIVENAERGATESVQVKQIMAKMDDEQKRKITTHPTAPSGADEGR